MSYAAAGVLASGVAATSRATLVGAYLAPVSTSPTDCVVFSGSGTVVHPASVDLSPADVLVRSGSQANGLFAQTGLGTLNATLQAGCLVVVNLASLQTAASTGGAVVGGQPPNEEVRRSTAGATWTVGERVRKRRKRQEEEDVLLLS